MFTAVEFFSLLLLKVRETAVERFTDKTPKGLVTIHSEGNWTLKLNVFLPDAVCKRQNDRYKLTIKVQK